MKSSLHFVIAKLRNCDYEFLVNKVIITTCKLLFKESLDEFLKDIKVVPKNYNKVGNQYHKYG